MSKCVCRRQLCVCVCVSPGESTLTQSVFVFIVYFFTVRAVLSLSLSPSQADSIKYSRQNHWPAPPPPSKQLNIAGSVCWLTLEESVGAHHLPPSVLFTPFVRYQSLWVTLIPTSTRVCLYLGFHSLVSLTLSLVEDCLNCYHQSSRHWQT